jgi:hypothetical protein
MGRCCRGAVAPFLECGAEASRRLGKPSVDGGGWTVKFKALPTEIYIALFMVALLLLLSALFGLPVVYPTGERAGFVGIHYLYPLLGVAVWGLFALIGQKKALGRTFLIALPCYAVVLFCHFNIKLWVPHINPLLFDQFYWDIDQALRPVVLLCMAIRRAMVAIIPYKANFYMIAYIAMFYGSFCYHAVRTPEKFGELVVAALLVQTLGTIGYLLAPALGPFIYEAGVDPTITGGQQGMLAFHNEWVAQGPEWLARNGGVNFTVGLAAMPSLHSASAFLFFLFAWKYGRVLLPLYAFTLFFILVTAIASRWHYLIDLPVGMAIAWGSARAAERLARPSNGIVGAEDSEPVPVGQLA